MVSITRFFQRTVPAMLLAVFLLLTGCSPAPQQLPGSGEPLPPAPEQTAAPDEAATAPPQGTVPEEETPAPLREQEPCGFLMPLTAVAQFTCPEDGSVFFAQDGAVLEERLRDRTVLRRTDSLDGSACMLVTSRGELWLVRQGQLRFIGETGAIAALSNDGTALIWTDRAGILTHYCCETGESTSISAGVRTAALSPDGHSLAYATANPDGSTSAWLWTDGTARLLGEELLPFALCDSASLVYALGTDDGELYILDDTGAAAGPSCPLDSTGQLFLSSDHRQILFPSRDLWCIRSQGEEAEPVTLAQLSRLVLPLGSLENTVIQPELSVTALPTENLWCNFFLDRENTLYYMEPGRAASAVAETIPEGAAQVSRDGSTVFYLWEDGTLFRTQRCCIGSPTILAGDVVRFLPTGDLTGVYCLDTAGNLRYLQDFQEPKLISEGVCEFKVTRDDHCLYLTQGSEEEGSLLFGSLRGYDSTALDTRIRALHTDPTAAYYITEEEDCSQIYWAGEGLHFVPLWETERQETEPTAGEAE